MVHTLIATISFRQSTENQITDTKQTGTTCVPSIQALHDGQATITVQIVQSKCKTVCGVHVSMARDGARWPAAGYLDLQTAIHTDWKNTKAADLQPNGNQGIGMVPFIHKNLPF